LLSVVPVLLMIRFGKERCRVSLALAVLVILTTALTLWYARWGYFLALFFALSLPWALSRLPWRPVVGALFLLSLWPMAREWDRQLFPNESTLARRAEMRREAVALRAVAERLRVSGPGVVLAPWWLSPAIAYWSGHPCVAGSSHQSLPGIVDTAKFFLATHPIEAKEILARRKVRWVLGDDPARVLPNSAQILGVPAPRDALGAKLPRGTAETPSGLIPLGTDGYYTLFTVDPDALAR
jgi:hypothetical protein